VVRGAEGVAAEEGYAVLLCDGRETSPAAHLETLRTRQVDGVILAPSTVAAAPEDVLRNLNVVVVEEPSERFPWVASDAAGAGRTAAEHLLELGHRRVGVIGPSTVRHGFRMRERGFVQALREAGVGLPSEWLRRVPASVEGGRAAMAALLARDDRPTAVFCVNDLLALGALKACLVAGVAVPGEVSLIGCDDIEMARIVTPELTTLAVPAREIGARAVRLLVRQLDGRGPARPSRPRPLPVRLVRRQTTGPVPRS
jgi:LacI family transcriptional regulator